MNLKENYLSPEEVRAEDPNTETAQALSDLLTEEVAENIPEPQPQAEPVHTPAPEAAPQKSAKKKPHIAIRVPLQILSFVLALALFVTTLAGALVLDLQAITSSGGIKQIINIAMNIITSAPEKATREPSRISPMSSRSKAYDEADGSAGALEDALEDSLGGEDLDIGLEDIPQDILTGENTEESINGLVDWVYDQVDAATEEELPLSKEQIQGFVEDSTVTEYVTDKLADFTEDFINGTSTVTITADEIMELLEENEEAMKEHLQIELSPEVKEEIRASVEKMVEDTDINNVIREEVFGAVEDMMEESTQSMGVNMDEIRGALQTLTSPSMRLFVILVNVALVLLLCLLNFYNVPAGLTWAAFPCIFSGAILTLPLTLMKDMTVTGDAAGIADAIMSFADLFKPVHFGLLAIGFGLLAISIIWRIIRGVIRNAK